MHPRIALIASLLVALLLLAACQAEPTPSPYTGYLTEEIPPCTPVAGSSVDPCESRGAVQLPEQAGASPYLGDAPIGVNESLTLNDGPAWVIQIVVRGTYIPDTGRCTSGTRFRRIPSFMNPDEIGDPLQIKCFADVRANDYILGAGPPRLTLQTYWHLYPDGYYGEVSEDKTHDEVVESLRVAFEQDIDSEVSGREMILFLFASL